MWKWIWRSLGKSKNLTKCEECKDNYKYFLDESTNTKTCFPYEEDYPKEFPSINIDNILKCEWCGLEDVLNNKCIIDNPSIEYLEIIYNELKNEMFFYHGEDKIVNINKNIALELAKSLNEKENLYKNQEEMKNYYLSIIDLGVCESELKNQTYIPEDESLITLKFEQYYENSRIKNVQFEIYHPLTLDKIHLSLCYSEKLIYIFQ